MFAVKILFHQGCFYVNFELNRNLQSNLAHPIPDTPLPDLWKFRRVDFNQCFGVVIVDLRLEIINLVL